MKTFAEFQILGRIGKVREVGQTTRVSICANYAFKDRNGETKDKPYWNEITIRSESARKYVRDYGSCPSRWCSLSDVIFAFSGLGRVDQAATAGGPTTGSSLKGAMVSSVM